MFSIPALIALAKRFWPVLVIIAVLIVVAIVYREGREDGAAKPEKARLEANVKAGEQKAVADEKAAETRLDDTVRLNTEQSELKEAVANAPDDPASRRRMYYDCLGRLQQARREGRDPASAEC